jgi:hypothetical protein
VNPSDAKDLKSAEQDVLPDVLMNAPFAPSPLLYGSGFPAY